MRLVEEAVRHRLRLPRAVISDRSKLVVLTAAAPFVINGLSNSPLRQRPICSDFAASAASASAGSGGSFGLAQPCRTIQVERSVPPTAQRAVNDFCSPGSGRSQTTARARISRLSATFAAAPQGQFLPLSS